MSRAGKVLRVVSMKVDNRLLLPFERPEDNYPLPEPDVPVSRHLALQSDRNYSYYNLALSG